jgi:hypothetical protein
MKITDIRNNNPQDARLPIFKPEELKLQNSEKSSKSDEINIFSKSSETSSTQWQKDVLLSALDELENNIQDDDNHPLGKLSNAPIESYDEALIELSFLKTPMFKETASEAQANLTGQDVLYLFTEELV